MTRLRRPTFLAALILAAVATACDAAPATAPTGLPVVDVTVGSKTYHLEVAADSASREKGLMERDTLAADHGMIFVFAHPQEQKFWMHHTRFDLDIVYLDENGAVVSVHNMKAYDESAVPSNGESKYAIELAAGQAAACGIKAKDKVTVPTTVGAAKD